MNATMTVTVRVVAGQAQQAARAVEKDLKRLNTGVGQGTAGLTGFNRALMMPNLVKFGKNLQWTGRQLEYSFTLPIMLAGVAATKWANEIAGAMVLVRKVYGDGTESASQLKAELDALARSFELLSNRFGIAQKEVIEIAANWARAGSAGVGLAKATRLTMEAMILGTMDAEQASKALIAMTSIFRLTMDETADSAFNLKTVLGQVNAIENNTTIAFGEIIEVLSRAGGVARTAGIDIRHLGAMAAALVPAAGSGAQAGNGLRTMISRLMAPTREAGEVLGLMGINIFEATWQAKNGVERIETLADAFVGLTSAQQATVSSIIASRWQINRFDVLMNDIASRSGQYATALDVTSDPMRVMGIYVRELNEYLTSTPQAFKILQTQMQNAMARAIMPMLPAIIAVMTRITQLIQAFTRLDPAWQQLIMSAMLLLAVVGPITRVLGAAIQLFVLLGKVAVFPAKAIGALVGALVSFKVLAVAAVVGAVAGLVYIFRDELAPAIEFALRMFHALPQGVQQAMINVVKVVSRAVLTVYEWLSYLNPFARHSPSLVDNVKAGVATILNEYSRLSGVADIIRSAIRAHEAFQVATAGGRQQYKMQQFAEKRQDIISISPGSGPAVDAMIRAILNLEGALERMVPVIAEQATVTARWEERLKAAKRAVDDAARSLEWLEVAAKAIQDQLDAATQHLDALTSTGIQGFAALEQSIFNNETAQARLNLELLRVRASIPGLHELEASIRSMRSEVTALRAELDRANDQLSRFSGARLIGLRQMEDAIFSNEMAQKRLRLEMLRMEEAGEGFDDVAGRLAAMQGEIEKLRGEQTDLRLAGAGSDVTGPIQEQIDAIEAARRQLASSGGPYAELENELKNLQRQGQILDLEKSLEFDPLLRQISQLTDMTQEMSFDQIIQGIQRWQPEVSRLTAEYDQQSAALRDQEAELARLQARYDAMTAPLQRQIDLLQRQNEEMQLISRIEFAPLQRQLEQLVNPIREMPFDELYASIQNQVGVVDELQKRYDVASAAVDRQRAVVDALKRTHDGISERYDQENQKLRELRSAYSDIESQVRDLESALNEMATAAKAAREAAGKEPELSNAMKLFEAGAMGDFDQPMGTGGIGREGGLAEIEAFNAELERELEESMQALAGVDILKPLRDAIGRAFGNLKEKVKGWIDPIKETIQNAFGGINLGGTEVNFGEGAISSLRGMKENFSKIVPDIKKVLEPVGKFFGLIGEALIRAGKVIAKEFKNWGVLADPFVRGMQNVAKIVGSILGILVWLFRTAFDTLLPIVKPALDAVVEIIRAALQIIRGVLQIFFAFLAGDWTNLWQGLITVVDGIWDAIYAVISNGLEMIFGIFKQIFDRIVGVFKWLYNVLVGNSIVPDLVNAIIKLFNILLDAASKIWDAIAKVIVWAWQNVILPVWRAMEAVWNSVLRPLLEVMLRVFQTIWNAIGAVIKWAWDNIIQPTWRAIQFYWDNVLHPLLRLMQTVFKAIWDAIGAVIKFAWEHVIRPVWEAFKRTWDVVLRPVLNVMKSAFETIWNAIGNTVKWTWENVILPAVRAIGNIWHNYLKGPLESMRDGFGRIFSGIGNAVKSGINFAIDVLNTLIQGISTVANVLPGVSISIGQIPKIGGNSTPPNFGPVASDRPVSGAFAKGGVLDDYGRIPATDIFVRQGFATKMPRAIVGEGSPLHPEYVIPTDPAHRRNAERLYSDLGARLGVPAPRAYAEGGIVGGDGTGGLLDPLGDAVGWAGRQAKRGIGAVRRGAAIAAFGPFLPLVDKGIDQIPRQLYWVKDMMHSLKNTVYDWVKGEDQKLPETPDVSYGGAMQWINMWRVVQEQFSNARLHSAFRPGAITATGNRSLHAQGRAIDISPRMDIFNWLASNYPNAYELIFSPARSRQLRHGRSHVYGEPTKSMHYDHIHWGMAEGGIVPMRAGGIVSSPTQILAGEAGAEAILPLDAFMNPMLEAQNSVVAVLLSNEFSDMQRHQQWLRMYEELWLEQKSYITGQHEASLVALDEAVAPMQSWMENNPIAEKIAEFDSNTTSGLNELQSSMMQGFSDLSQSFGDQISNLSDSLRSALSGRVTTQDIQRMFQQYNVSPRKGAAQGESDMQRFQRIANDINSGARTLEQVERSIQWLANSDLPLTPMRAGGIVTSPTAILAGEAGPEAILPLNAFMNPMLEKLDGIIGAQLAGNLDRMTFHQAWMRNYEEHWIDEQNAAGQRHDSLLNALGEQVKPLNNWLQANPLNETLIKGFSDLQGVVGAMNSSMLESIGSLQGSLGDGFRSIQDAFQSPGSTGVTSAQIQALFAQYGVAGTKGISGETEAQRYARIAQEINSGTRTMEQFLKSLTWLQTANLANGGIVKATPGGTIVRLAERGKDEAVVPLSNAAASLLGGTSITINGDLVMPNIRSGKDAKTFIENLEALVN